MGIGAFIAIVVPIVIAIVWCRKKKEPFTTVLIGAADRSSGRDPSIAIEIIFIAVSIVTFFGAYFLLYRKDSGKPELIKK